MSTVPKLGNNRYLATSKNVNRMLTQLNGILSADNITVQNIPATIQTISLANGNFINITMPANISNPTYTFINKNPGVYYLLFTLDTGSSGVTLTDVKKNGTIVFDPPKQSLITIICDGTNMYEISRNLSLA